MKKCIIILPYFGKFNNYFNLFLKSCEKNPDFNWLIFTDDKSKYNYPENVRVEYMKFSEFCDLVQKKFNFKIALETPYKLCDYKPAYGYILQEYIKEYKFWGYCDCDIIFGKINEFITDSMLENYDRLFTVGHFSIFKNNNEVNTTFMKSISGKEYYKTVYSNNKNFAFDELVFNDIFKNTNLKFYKIDLSYNISVYYYNFRITRRIDDVNRYFTEDYMPTVTLWNNGNLERYYFSEDDGRLLKNEYMYIHLQHRKMKNNLKNINKYQILPNVFLDLNKRTENIDSENFLKIKKNHISIKEVFKCFSANIKWKIKAILRKKRPTKFTRGNMKWI